MRTDRIGMIGALAATALSTIANAGEPSGALVQTAPGVLIGASAGVPPPGIYMFNYVSPIIGNLTGPITKSIGSNTGFQSVTTTTGAVFVPGWTFLGATYNAVLVQPALVQSVGQPINTQVAGLHNTYIVPVELSWMLGDSGFAVKTGLGLLVPDGTSTGPAGTGNVGSPFWTFQPELIVSYLKDGWNLTAAVYAELNTKNAITKYRSGDILHADFTATKRIGKWTLGPVAYYVGQVSNDQSSAYYNNLLGTQRWNIWSVGGLVGYDFGPASLTVWATRGVSTSASGASIVGGVDRSSTVAVTSVLARLSYRLWAPEGEPAAKRLAFTK